MQTITFYAYKGGTGRTLALANAAKYLARLGLSVVAMDLDLESPGLHYKFSLGDDDGPVPMREGLVDCLDAFVTRRIVPVTLNEYAVRIPAEREGDGGITILPAGSLHRSDYWNRLAGINWHEFFCAPGSMGIPFFLELKELILKDFSPDFLLIDARTGVTEIGGVATSILPDIVVCLLVNNQENLDGSREVMRGIARVSAQRGKPIRTVPVLARVPVSRRGEGSEDERQLVERVRQFLTERPSDAVRTPEFDTVHVLHSEDSLAFREELRVGGKRSIDESPLLRDYLRLFSQIVPRERVEPRIDRLIEAAMESLLDAPDRVQSDLESLALHCPHPASYLALMKFYRLRKAPPEQLLDAAVRYREVGGNIESNALQEVVRDCFTGERRRARLESNEGLARLVEAVWRSSAPPNPKFGLRLVDLLSIKGEKRRASHIIQEILAQPNSPPHSVVAACISKLVDVDDLDIAGVEIDRWMSALASDSQFQAAWARWLVKRGDLTAARNAFENRQFSPATILSTDPDTYVRLLILTDRRPELEAAAAGLLQRAAPEGDIRSLLVAQAAFERLGRIDEFQDTLRRSASRSVYERVLRGFSAPFRGRAFDLWPRE